MCFDQDLLRFTIHCSDSHEPDVDISLHACYLSNKSCTVSAEFGLNVHINLLRFIRDRIPRFTIVYFITDDLAFYLILLFFIIIVFCCCEDLLNIRVCQFCKIRVK